MEADYDQAFGQLNDEQKAAVRQIDGPVLVIAGPGSGKTQLLALRAAEILRRDDTMLPGNILCLTFTDSAANNMRERLVRYIGQDAYQVAIHTFNSFGQYVINAYPEYFSQWREIKTADELTIYRILEDILAQLPGNHPLAGRGQDGSYFAQGQIKNLIGDAKRADLTPEALEQIIKENRAAYELLLPVLRRHWPASTGSKAALAQIAECIEAIQQLPVPVSKIPAVVPLVKIIKDSLHAAAQEADALDKGQSKPFTAWKNEWLEKDDQNQLVFIGQRHQDRLFAAVEIYKQYETRLDTQHLADFNDQIMRVLAAMRRHDALRYNLQERFQYIMIDEFQDTNRSQLLMARYLTDAPVHEGRPNILVVGDDDQAIFRFQGADIGNVGLFKSFYKEPAVIQLKLNYRSNPQILQGARQIANQIEFSLATQEGAEKDLTPTVENHGHGLKFNQFEYESQHCSYVAQQIHQLLDQGVKGQEIAVLARERAQLDALVPYLRQQKVPMNYERRENVLQKDHIISLLIMARLVYALQIQNLPAANVIFAQVLSHPMWDLKPSEIWQISTEAYSQKIYWLDVITAQKDGRPKQIAEFFIALGLRSGQLPLEQVLDELIGTQAGDFTSPFKDYYFDKELLQNHPAQYLTLLSHLNTLRQHLRNYQTDQAKTLYISDLVEFIDAYNRADGLTMLDRAPHNEDTNAVQLMTVHKSKGLEFDNVFVVGLQNDVWTRSGGRGRFSYPANLKAIRPSDNQDDDGLRLLYVAMTRARQSLFLNYFLKNDQGDPSYPYAPLLGLSTMAEQPKVTDDTLSLATQYEQRWLRLHSSTDGGKLQSFFEDQLNSYKLSATDLNNFLDVTVGGPDFFFSRSLLHFPAAQIPAATYGSLIHAALSQAHNLAAAGQPINIKAILQTFQEGLMAAALTKADKESYLERGRKALETYLTKSGDIFSQEQAVDVNFRNQHACVGEVRLQGLIDRLDLNRQTKTAVISDYKTGNPETRWQLAPKTEEYRKVKMHLYKNQLLFYKLLLESGSDWGRRGWTASKAVLRFVEPDDYGKIRTLELEYETKDLERYKKLLQRVWDHIQGLDFPDTSGYPATLEGVIAFEEDLLS